MTLDDPITRRFSCQLAVSNLRLTLLIVWAKVYGGFAQRSLPAGTAFGRAGKLSPVWNALKQPCHLTNSSV